MKIISLIASGTEIVHSLGNAKDLVGISHECDYPISIKSLPICSEPRFNVDGKSVEVDTQIKSLLQSALSVYRVREDVISKLSPDIIITQSQCDVCAVNIKDVRSALDSILGIQPEIISLEPNNLNDVWCDIKDIANILNKDNEAMTMLNGFNEDIRIIKEKNKQHKPISIGCIEWIEPLMFAGNWVPEIVNIAGGIDLFGKAGHHSEWSEYEELYSKDPDKIIFMPCGFTIERTESELKELIQLNKWNSLKAVKEGQVYLTDGNQYFNRPGPRLLDSIKIMDDIINDDNTHSLRGTGWKKIGT